MALVIASWLGTGVVHATEPPDDEPTPLPNVVLILSDDHGWPYYGFMQRYLREKLARGEFVADPNNVPEGFEHPEIVLPEDRLSSTPFTDCGVDDPGCRSCSGTNCSAPLHRILTPAIDRLAEEGSYFPWGHTGAAVCKPSLVSLLTGLHISDFVRNGADNVLSPTLTEFLPGFEETTGPLSPTTYLTMAAGKWSFEKTIVEPTGQLKFPFDRDFPRRNPRAGGEIRRVLQARQPGGPALERIREFIDCATCKDPSKCRLPKDEINTDPDSPRLDARVEQCSPQPFFLVFGPSIPHLNSRATHFCPLFPRDAQQCDDPAYRDHSVYCQYDPIFDLDGNGVIQATEHRACDYVLRNTARTTLNLYDERRSEEYSSLRRNFQYLEWVNVLDRAVDEIVVILKSEGIYENTVFLLISDNGFNIAGKAKGHFGSHGLRSPIILHDAREPATPPTCGPGLPGCQDRFAHAVDILATLRDLSGAGATTCPPPGDSCIDCCPEANLDGSSAYEGVSLTDHSPRACLFPADFPESEKPRFRQCMLGRKNLSGQGIGPGQQFYVLAEVEEPGPTPRTHICRAYRRGCGGADLFDLGSDPSENVDLTTRPRNACGREERRLAALLRFNVERNGWLDCPASHWPEVRLP